MRAFAVRCERDVVDVAEAQEGIDVRLVRLAREWVTQEDDALDLLRRDEGTNLLVAAEGARHHGFDVEAERVADERTGRARSDEVEVREQLFVMPDEFQHLVLLLVMGDEGDSQHVWLLSLLKNDVIHMSSIEEFGIEVKRILR